MQYDWTGAGRRKIQAITATDDTQRYWSLTSVNAETAVTQTSKHPHILSWSKRIIFGLAVFLGCSAVVTTALAAAVSQHEMLHTQFCHDVHHLAAAEPLLRAGLALVGLDPA